MNNKFRIVEIIKSFISINGEINEDDSLLSIGIDSLKIVELIIELEDRLGIQFNAADLDPSKLVLVKDIINLVSKYNLVV